MRRSRRIYKRKTRSNLETLIILVGAIVILSVAFYMAREKSYLPPVELELERQSISKEEAVKLSEEEQKETEQLIIPDISIGEKLPEPETVIPQKPAEKEIPAQPTEQAVQKESGVPAGQPVSVPPKQETPVTQIETQAPPGSAYTVQVGFFSLEANARGLAKEIENKGYQVFVIKHNDSFKVQVGAYSSREQAEEASRQLKRMDYETWVTQR